MRRGPSFLVVLLAAACGLSTDVEVPSVSGAWRITYQGMQGPTATNPSLLMSCGVETVNVVLVQTGSAFSGTLAPESVAISLDCQQTNAAGQVVQTFSRIVTAVGIEGGDVLGDNHSFGLVVESGQPGPWAHNGLITDTSMSGAAEIPIPPCTGTNVCATATVLEGTFTGARN